MIKGVPNFVKTTRTVFGRVRLHTLIGGVLLSSGGQKKPISHDFLRSLEEPKVAKKEVAQFIKNPTERKKNNIKDSP